MFYSLFSEMCQKLNLIKAGWAPWMFLYFTLSGTLCLVEVVQPPVLVTPLAHNVIMQCQLTLSPEAKLIHVPFLYWEYLRNEGKGFPKVWPPSDKYTGRVDLVDNNNNSSNKSIRLKNVQWTDSGTYRCKLSITREGHKSERKKGHGTILKVYDVMFFNTTGDSDSLLQCAVSVTPDSWFVLSIFHDEFKLQTVGSTSRNVVSHEPYVTLSESTPLRSQGEYECQLHLNETLITKSTFYYDLTESDGWVPSEPWLLYVALLLVPLTFLLALIICLATCRHWLCQHLAKC